MNKTGRKRGQTYHLIMGLAAILGKFTPDMLTPALPRDVARRNCSALAQSGRLVLIRPGARGRFGTLPWYQHPASRTR